ncbi:DUF4388 domain-containing protein [candidate division KSB1 bacterium]|nr:DUF4388 domain-containing protein [candidate division KSB1 bacterium]
MAQAELKGNIQFMSLGTLLSLNCSERLTTRLEIESENTVAEIFIENGNIVHARIGSETGEKAFYKIFALKEGIFSSYPNQNAPENTIKKNWGNLLLESSRLLDENSSNQGQEMDWKNFELPDFDGNQLESVIDERIHRLTKALRNLKGILGVTVISHDSKVLGNDAEFDAPDCVQNTNNLLTAGKKLGNLIGAGCFMHAIIRNSQNTILINRGQDVLFILAEKDVISDVLINDIYIIMKRYR